MYHRKKISRRALSLVLIALIALTLAGLFQQGQSLAAYAANNGVGQHPLLGWSSWSSLHESITDAKIRAEADSMASHLKSVGFTYINIDSGWTSSYDSHGRPVPNLTKFPQGIAGIAAYVHSKGLKLGIYMLPGMPQTVWTANDTVFGTKISVRNFTDTSHQGNTEGNAYRIDYSKPGAVQYIQSIANLYASWGVDYIKFDFVGPGGGKVAADDTADMHQWETALKATGRPIWIELSNNLSIADATTWQAVANGWRITGDVECYSHCPYLTDWAKVSTRFAAAAAWTKYAGPGGWNDLDSLEIGNGTQDGLTLDERQTTMTLWAISAAPLSLGTDLTKLDPTDLSLLTNTRVLAVDQAGRAAHPISLTTQQQVWWVQNANGSYTVAFFNLASATARVSVSWSSLGFSGTRTLTNLWTGGSLGNATNGYSASVVSHGTLLFNVAA